MAVSRLGSMLLVAGVLMLGTGTQARQSSTAPATSSRRADKAAVAQTAAAKKAAAAAAQLVRDARNAGFTAENVGGALMFCRLDTELGSRFLVKTCYDELQMRIKIEQYRTQRNELEAIHHIQ